jgi:hypothetical protein
MEHFSNHFNFSHKHIQAIIEALFNSLHLQQSYRRIAQNLCTLGKVMRVTGCKVLN